MADGSGSVPQPLIIKTDSDGSVGVTNYANKYSVVVQMAMQMYCYQDIDSASNIQEKAQQIIKYVTVLWNNLPAEWRAGLLPKGADTGDV